MRIGYLCSDVDVQLFGNEGCSIHIRQFTDALVQAGHDVFIACSWMGDPSKAPLSSRVYEVTPQGFDAVAWRLLEREPAILDNHLERDLRSVLQSSWFRQSASGIFEREQPDLLYERYALFGWAGAELSRRYDIPLIIEVNAPLCQQQVGYEKFPLTGLAEGIEPEILRAADAVIALTGWLKDWCISLGVAEHRIHVIPDGVNSNLFGAEVSGNAVRERYGLKGKRVVGHVGSFHPWHDVRSLLKAFRHLYADCPDLRLLLVGSGEGRESLKKTVEQLGLDSAVIFAGSVPHESVPEYLAAMDVAVVPYQQISDFFFSPLKLFESMAVGVPTVAAALGQIEEVVEHGQTGWLYPAGNEQKLAEILAMLLETPDLAARIGRAGRARVLGEFTWQAVTRQVMDIGQELIRARNTGTQPEFANRKDAGRRRYLPYRARQQADGGGT